MRSALPRDVSSLIESSKTSRTVLFRFAKFLIIFVQTEKNVFHDRKKGGEKSSMTGFAPVRFLRKARALVNSIIPIHLAASSNDSNESQHFRLRFGFFSLFALEKTKTATRWTGTELANALCFFQTDPQARYLMLMHGIKSQL